MPLRPGNGAGPAASILIPSSGRPETLELTLDALRRQTVPPTEFEVIVVDDGAVPPLEARLAPYAGGLRLRSVRLERKGPGAARNAAAKIAAARLLVFLDDDCVPAAGWLEAYLDAFRRLPESALAGPILNGLPDDVYAEAYHLIFGYLYSRHVNPRGVESNAPFIISANFAVAAELFEKIGGFDESFGIAAEDRMFSESWVRHGEKFQAVPGAAVFHHRPFTFRTYLAQQYRYGRGGMILRRALAERGESARAFEPGSFYRGLILTALHHPGRAKRIPLFLLLILSQAAIAAGYAAEFFRA